MSKTERFCNQNEHVLRDLPERGFQGAPEGPRKVKTALFPVWRGEKFPQAEDAYVNLVFPRTVRRKVLLLTYLHTYFSTSPKNESQR